LPVQYWWELGKSHLDKKVKEKEKKNSLETAEKLCLYASLTAVILSSNAMYDLGISSGIYR